MRPIIVGLLAVLSLGFVQAEVLSESNKEVGFGFRIVYRSQTNPPGSFEAIGHFAFLYYKDIELSQTDVYSIAPSGNYALYQDGPTGAIILFRPVSRQKQAVGAFSGSLAAKFAWAEETGKATITFENGGLLPIKLTEP